MANLSAKEKDSALNEIRLLASISSPNVIEYKTAFFDEPSNQLCIVMEYADGGDLAVILILSRVLSKKNKRRDKNSTKISSGRWLTIF